MGSGCSRLEMLQLQQKVRKKMKGRKIRIRQGIKGWLLALAMVLSLCSGWKQDVCAQQSQSSSSILMQDVDTDKKGSIEILFDTMRDEPVANAEFTLYQVAAMVDRGGYTVLELTGGFESCGVQLKNLTAQHSLAAAQAKLSGSAQDALRARVTELTSKIDVQKGIVQQNGQQYDNLKQKLELQKTAHDQLKTKVEAAKKAYEDSAKATGEDSEETQKLKAEYEKLSSQLSTSESQLAKTEPAITKQEAAVNQSKAALTEMEAELKNVNAELARAPFDEYAGKAQ